MIAHWIPEFHPKADRPTARRVHAAALVSLLVAPLVTLSAQRAELREGARVRIRAPGVVAGRLEGTVLGVLGNTLRFAATTGAPLAVPIDRITEAYIYRGKSKRAGAAKGALWGAGVGVILGGSSAAMSDCFEPNCSPGDNVVGGAVLAVFSTGIGALIGAGRGGDHWERLVLP